MRIFRPSGSPTWLESVLRSIEQGLRGIWPLPFRLWRSATADLPAASDHEGAWLYDSDAKVPKFSNGTAWSASEPAIAAGSATDYWRGDKTFQPLNGAAVANTPAGSISALTVQAALNELDTEKLSAGSYTAEDIRAKLLTVDGAGSGIDADLLDGQSGAHYLARANHTGTQAAATISDFSEAADDRIVSLLAGSEITRTYDDAAGTLTLSIADDVVTNSKLANMAQATIKGRASAAGTGDPTDLSAAQVAAIVGSAGQIPFPATQIPSADPNTLDDYEEGTFTPEMRFGGASTGITYSTQLGRYTKIGRLVFFEIRLVFTSKGTSVGTSIINGLPFTSAAAPFPPVSVQLNNVTGFNAPASAVSASSTQVAVSNFNGATLATATDAMYANNSAINIAGVYVAA